MAHFRAADKTRGLWQPFLVNSLHVKKKCPYTPGLWKSVQAVAFLMMQRMLADVRMTQRSRGSLLNTSATHLAEYESHHCTYFSVVNPAFIAEVWTTNSNDSSVLMCWVLMCTYQHTDTHTQSHSCVCVCKLSLSTFVRYVLCSRKQNIHFIWWWQLLQTGGVGGGAWKLHNHEVFPVSLKGFKCFKLLEGINCIPANLESPSPFV